MMDISGSSVSVQIELKSGDIGKVIPFFMNSEFVPMPDLVFIDSWSLSLKLGFVAEMELSLRIPFQYTAKILDSELFECFNVLSMQVFRPDGKGTARYSGYIIEPEVSGLGESSISVSLKAFGIGYDLVTKSGTGKVYETTSIKGTLEKVFEVYGLDKPMFPKNLPSDHPLVKDLEDKKKITDSYKTVWQFIEALAKQGNCYWKQSVEETTGKNVIEFVEIEKIHSKPSTRLFAVRSGGDFQGLDEGINKSTVGQILGDTNVYPLSNFSTESTNLFLPGSTQAMRIADIVTSLKEKKEKIEKVIEKNLSFFFPSFRNTGEKTPSSKTGVKQSITPKGASGDKALGSATEEKKSTLAFECEESAFYGGWKVEGETIGIPDLEPGHKGKIVGLCKRLDGDFVITEVEHSGGLGAWKTKFTGYKNSTWAGGVSSDSTVEPVPAAKIPYQSNSGKQSNSQEQGV